jgi:cellulose synthase/poly-beta-1,6-N-acetylglucosamine synthase-like glycosyltransferase
MSILEITFWALAFLVVYVYFGYPLLLVMRVWLRPYAVTHGSSEPSVTLIISAFNEQDVIADKIENSLALDYQKDNLEIMIVSDASHDGTDEIVKMFAERGVKLLRMPERGGKTAGLNEAVKQAIGEIVVFSDANAMYRHDAIKALVRNFEDPSVGAAVGESTYNESTTDAEKSESAYWRYETYVKRLETRIGSVIGGDGAIYAIRKGLYRTMAADALSDFVNPLQIVEQGKRCVYEPDAISVEKAAGSYGKEFRRKVRIVNRAWRAMMSMKNMLNPLRYGFFSWELISHKLLRWLVPVFLLAIFLTNVALIARHPVYQVALVAQCIFYGLAVAGALQRHRDLAAPMYIPFYFCLVNIASARGILEAYRGKTYTTWSTARTEK